MKPNPNIPSPAELAALQQLDSCVVANAIETFHERPRNEGFADGSIRCLFPELPPMVGYAATLKVRGTSPPMMGGAYSDRTDWWDYLTSLPSPRILVVEDLETSKGTGSLLGEVHQNIIKVLGCVGAITNGSIRDLPSARKLGLQMFSGSVAVSHAYVHIVEFGTPVKIAGVNIHSGDLIHGDLHGFQTIPQNRAREIPDVAASIKEKERPIIELCHSDQFSLKKLRAAVSS